MMYKHVEPLRGSLQREEFSNKELWNRSAIENVVTKHSNNIGDIL